MEYWIHLDRNGLESQLGTIGADPCGSDGGGATARKTCRTSSSVWAWEAAAARSFGASSEGGAGPFVHKLDAQGGTVWSRPLGGLSIDMAAAVHVPPDGAVLIAGTTSQQLGGARTTARTRWCSGSTRSRARRAGRRRWARRPRSG